MEFTTTAKAAPPLYYNGFEYSVNWRNASSRIYWRCGVNRKCDGSVTAKDGVLIIERMLSTHTLAKYTLC